MKLRRRSAFSLFGGLFFFFAGDEASLALYRHFEISAVQPSGILLSALFKQLGDQPVQPVGDSPNSGAIITVKYS